MRECVWLWECIVCCLIRNIKSYARIVGGDGGTCLVVVDKAMSKESLTTPIIYNTQTQSWPTHTSDTLFFLENITLFTFGIIKIIT